MTFFFYSEILYSFHTDGPKYEFKKKCFFASFPLQIKYPIHYSTIDANHFGAKVSTNHPFDKHLSSNNINKRTNYVHNDDVLPVNKRVD